jgi:hypothetical protein
MSANETKSKVTYSYEQRHVLLLKESFSRDLDLFRKLLENTPRDWSLTVIKSGDSKELVVNIPTKK